MQVRATFCGQNTPDTTAGTWNGDLIFGWNIANPPGDQGKATDAAPLSSGLGDDELPGGRAMIRWAGREQ